LLLSVLAFCPLLAYSWSTTRRDTSLSELSLEILGYGRFLDNYNDDADNAINEQCSEYLVSFLEGTTDAKDTCDGIQNAYVAANCENLSAESLADDQDDYFGNFYEHKCCQSLLNRYSEYCDDSQLLSNVHLLLAASVLLLCEVAKSVVKSYDVHWLPEAGVCIIVGTLCGAIGHLLPGLDPIDDISFDGELFLTVLLPPIIFEAALSVSKKDFRRRRLAIFMFAVVGTILSTFITGTLVHWASRLLKNTTDIPILDCIIYGALISSIDPVAILSVLTSLNLSQSDTVFILVLGESLLNDGVAITLTQNLSSKFGQGSMTLDEVFGTIADFLIVAFGSIFVGFCCAIICMLFFWIFGKMLNPGMEVGSFFLWALIPYWICDGLEWSGIVSIVTMGFFMDVYVAAPQEQGSDIMPVDTVKADESRSLAALSNVTDPQDSTSVLPFGSPASPTSPTGDYTKMEDRPEDKTVVTYFSDGRRVMPGSIYRLNILRLLIHRDRIRLSEEADKHVRFVAHLLAQLCENAIFAYLGLFLFSGNYEWDAPLVTISVVICIVSRFLMVTIICGAIWYINILRRGVSGCGYEKEQNVSRTAVQLRNKNTQIVLMWAGLRGAVSLALVENIPLFNQVTKEGCEFKPVLKAMTSATIIFTTFIFGGSAYYVFPKLGIRPDKPQDSRGSISRESLSEAEEPFEMVNEIIVTDGSTPPRRGYEMRNMSGMTIENGIMS
jgi:NhaP-type Na+/H+ or K+/H+ antiporter